jgi:outer membrane protease
MNTIRGINTAGQALLYAVFVIVFFAQNAFGQEAAPAGEEAYAYTRTHAYAISLDPCFGFLYGQSEERVYPGNTKAEFLSQLLWDMKPVFYYGPRADFSRTNPEENHGFFSNLSLRFTIPGLSGNMEDRDWASVENDALTHYSTHDNLTGEVFLFDFSAGYAFPFLRVMILKAYVKVSYMHFSFSGFNGHGMYARSKGNDTYYSIDDKPRLYDFSGKIINYTQESLTAAPGVSSGYYFFKNFFAELSFRISPLIYCTALDEHLTTGTQFRDYVQGGLLIEPGAALSFACNDWISLSLEFSWRYIEGTTGTSFSRSYGAGYYTPSGAAGAGLSVLDTGFFLRIRL